MASLSSLLGCLLLLGTPVANGVWWTPQLHLPELAGIEQRLTAPFDNSIKVQKAGVEASIGNCAQYEQLSAAGYKPANDRALHDLQYYAVDCSALKCLRGVKQPRTSYVSGFALTPQALAQLPAAFAVSVSDSEGQARVRAEKRVVSWIAFHPKMTAQSKRNSLVAIDNGIRSILTLYARGDFNGDGIEDLLIRQDYSVERGTYSGSRLFLVTRRTPGQILQVLNQF